MKNKIFYLLIIAFLCFFYECKDDKTGNEAEQKIKETAIEIVQEKDVVQYSENIFDKKNVEFIKGEYLQRVLSDIRFKSKRITELLDTITSADDLPISKTVCVKETIYDDGSLYYQTIDNSSPDGNIVVKLNVNEQPVDEMITTTEIKNNVVYLYNSSQQLLKSQPIDPINLKPLLDSVQLYIAAHQNSIPQAQLVKRENAALQKLSAYGMKLVERRDNEIIVSMEIANQPSMLSAKMDIATNKKMLMSFSPDMSRMNYQKMYENDQLVNQTSFTYVDNSKNTNFRNEISGFSNELLPNMNVRQILNQKLSFKADGTPFIQTNVEIYKKNIVKYNFTK